LSESRCPSNSRPNQTSSWPFSVPCRPTRRYAHTPIRRYADTPIRRYAHTPIRPYAHTPIRSYAHTLIRSYAHTLIRSHADTPPRPHAPTFPLKSAGMTCDKLVRWAAAGKPLRPVFACSVPGVEAQAGDNDERVSSACVHGDPSSRAFFCIGAQYLGWRRGIHSANGMEDKRYGA